MGVLYYVYTPHVCLKPAKQTLPQCKHLAAGSPLHLPQGSVAQVALLWPVSSCVSPDSVPCREKTLWAPSLLKALLEVPPSPQLCSIALTHSWNIQTKPKPPTVALLLWCDAFYIMCVSGHFAQGILTVTTWLQEKKSVSKPCFG